MFDITGKTLKPVTDVRSSDEMERWWNILAEEGRAKKATESLQRSMTSTEIEALARTVFEDINLRAIKHLSLEWNRTYLPESQLSKLCQLYQ